MNLPFDVIAAAQIAWVVTSLWWFLRRSDEIPLVLSSINFYSMSYRFWVVQHGMTGWVSLVSEGYDPITADSALRALNAVLLGQTLLLGTYMLYQTRYFPPARGTLSPAISTWLKNWIMPAAVLYIPLALAVKYWVSANSAAGKSMAFEMSAYIYQLPYVAAGLIILLITLFRYGNWREGLRLVPVVLAAVLLYTIFGVSDRFKVVSSFIGSGIILGAAYRPKLRILFFVPVVAMAATAFSIAGSQREAGQSGEIEGHALERFINAHDANFLDGFVFSIQGTERFGYRYGGEHLEILYRPIPRSLWHNKPVGNYQLRATGQDKDQTGGTIGISPSLFGDFYMEGGYVGIVICSILYGLIFAAFIRRAGEFNPLFCAIIRGAFCGWLIALFRGGDIAGIVAWGFMSYWPIALFLYIWRREIKAGIDWVPTPIRMSNKDRTSSARARRRLAIRDTEAEQSSRSESQKENDVSRF
jgi:oligosaccharide repeat unit polymerase